MKLLVLVAILFTSLNGLAGTRCTEEPKANWISAAEIKEKFTKMGYKIKKFQIVNNCYEVYGINPNGERADIFFNPADGSVVKSEILK